MYKRVDAPQSDLEGFSYLNKNGNEEYVKVENTNWANIFIIDGGVDVYYEDIPNLIKALQAAYDYAKENNFV